MQYLPVAAALKHVLLLHEVSWTDTPKHTLMLWRISKNSSGRDQNKQ